MMLFRSCLCILCPFKQKPLKWRKRFSKRKQPIFENKIVEPKKEVGLINDNDPSEIIRNIIPSSIFEKTDQKPLQSFKTYQISLDEIPHVVFREFLTVRELIILSMT